uniref:SFRICE_028674 n=1 Tax=Spodoptera frugiperda TaxID=7108 RepID=A0A2H1WRP5_SPOFR
MPFRQALVMEDELSNDVDAVEYIDSNDEDEQAGETRPIMLLLRRLIRNKQNTVMTNAQILDILHSEFDICIKSSHELEINIYIKIIKRYLKDWPQWEELERISTKLSNCKDFEAITKVLNHKYKNLKEYLGVMLEVAKPLAKKAVEDMEASTQESNEVVVSDDSDDNPQIKMELQCSREQLNHLFLRHPDLDVHKTIFNLVPTPRRIRLGALNFTDIIKGWSVKFAINLPFLVLYRETVFKLKHALVNKARKGERKYKDNRLTDAVQEMTTKKTVSVPKQQVIQTLDDIATACSVNTEAFVILPSIFELLKMEVDKLVDTFNVPSSYRCFGSRYKYVRYLYTDEGENTGVYDLQLEEMMSPIYVYNIHIARGDYQPILLPPLAEWFKMECGVCNFKTVGNTVIEMKERFVGHVKDHIGDEPDWQCTNCLQTYSLKYLTMNRWFHNCHVPSSNLDF